MEVAKFLLSGVRFQSLSPLPNDSGLSSRLFLYSRTQNPSSSFHEHFFFNHIFGCSEEPTGENQFDAGGRACTFTSWDLVGSGDFMHSTLLQVFLHFCCDASSVCLFPALADSPDKEDNYNLKMKWFVMIWNIEWYYKQ